MAMKFIIVVFLAYLSAFVFAQETMGEPKEAGNGRSLLNLLAADEPPSIARFQVFPRDGKATLNAPFRVISVDGHSLHPDVLTMVVTETVCGTETSLGSSATETPPSSSIPSSTSVTPIVSSTAVSSVNPSTDVPSTSSSTPVNPSSSTRIDSSSSSVPQTQMPSSSTPVDTTISTPASPSSSSTSPSSILTPSILSTSHFVSSQTTDTIAPTNVPDPSTSTPPLSDVAFRQARMHTGIVMLLALINVLVIHF